VALVGFGTFSVSQRKARNGTQSPKPARSSKSRPAKWQNLPQAPNSEKQLIEPSKSGTAILRGRGRPCRFCICGDYAEVDLDLHPVILNLRVSATFPVESIFQLGESKTVMKAAIHPQLSRGSGALRLRAHVHHAINPSAAISTWKSARVATRFLPAAKACGHRWTSGAFPAKVR